MRHYERRLPHWDTVDQPLFVTFRLHGSLPAHRVFPPDSLARSGRAFVAMDRLLDRGANGPLCLNRPELAGMVVAALHDGERRFHRYQLHSYVVMPNHVHLLVTPKVVATRWLAPLKGFTAYRANDLLGSHGQAFWQDESYDHLVRSEAQFDRIQAYIEENPVKAGLVPEAHQHPWSSAASRLKGGCGQDWPPD
ncbi:MAG TPA: transposase [Candidatus Sulfopaludibacter sp.]|nr:transposase [Candidatus Sulfopaludibacter sp.]